MDITQILDGANDRELADAVTEILRASGRCSLNRHFSPRKKCSLEEQTAFTVWDSCAMICCSGFSKLIENDADLMFCAVCYERIRLNEIAGVFREVYNFTPERFQNQLWDEVGEEFADWTEDDSVYDQFRALDRQYYELLEGDAVPIALGRYLREHRSKLLTVIQA